MRKLALLIAVALLALPATALADVRRGDRGEEVRYLQWLLLNTGWLFEEPDGAFGGHTEQAVKNYQKDKGYEQTGVATYALMEEMETDRARLDREHYGPDYYQPYEGDFSPPFQTGVVEPYVAPAHCQTAVTPTLAWRDMCERHMNLLVQETDLCRQDDAERIGQACALWQADVRDSYAEWIHAAPAGERMDILAAWTAWNAALEAQRWAMLALWSDGPAVRRELTMMAREWATALCELRSGEPVTDPDIDVGDGTESEYEPFCSQWTLATGTAYAACCEAHAHLFEREHAWTRQGADAERAEAIAADWTDAVAGLYDRWMDGCNENQALAVARARDAYFEALTLQAEALAPYCGNAAIARTRAAEFECARLCEMLNAAMSH